MSGDISTKQGHNCIFPYHQSLNAGKTVKYSETLKGGDSQTFLFKKHFWLQKLSTFCIFSILLRFSNWICKLTSLSKYAFFYHRYLYFFMPTFVLSDALQLLTANVTTKKAFQFLMNSILHFYRNIYQIYKIQFSASHMNCEPMLLSLIQRLLPHSTSVLAFYFNITKKEKVYTCKLISSDNIHNEIWAKKPSITLSKYQTIKNLPFITCSKSNAKW